MYKKRGYNRDVPVELVKDYRLFAIACEGSSREPKYFSNFGYLSSRIKVDVIEKKITDENMKENYDTKSAPRWVLDRAVKYMEKEEFLEDDELWFVIDKDKWSVDQIKEIADYCKNKPNWNIALSNPCFEVWLYFHKKKDISKSESKNCNDFKKEISTFQIGGYNPLKFIKDVKIAVENAEKADTNPKNYLPELKQTKVYTLIKKMIAFIGPNHLDRFLSHTVPNLLKIEDEIILEKKGRKSKKSRPKKSR